MNVSCSVEVDCGNASECPEAFFKWTFDNRSLNSLPGLRFKTKVSFQNYGNTREYDITVLHFSFVSTRGNRSKGVTLSKKLACR